MTFPVSSRTADDPPHDVLVAGAGVVGLALALGLARTGLSVACVGPAAAARNGRTVALLDGSVRMLSALGVWDDLRDRGAPLARLRIVDATGSLFRAPPVTFGAEEIGLAAFGHNVENADLVDALSAAADAAPGLTRHDGLLSRYRVLDGRVEAELADGSCVGAGLLVAADGARSPTREAAGIGVRLHSYPQVALTAVLEHDRPHRETSTEFHTRQGPFTLVPLPDGASGSHRSSLVWVMTPAEAARRSAIGMERLAAEIEAQSQRLLGGVRVAGPLGRFPLEHRVAERLVGPRLALVGEAAHALPPIGAQGLNLSFRDAATLVDVVGEARRASVDVGSSRVLDRYERARTGDIALRAAGVDALNRNLLSDVLPGAVLRGLGMAAFNAVPFARRAVMRQGLMPRHGVPSLMA